MSVDNFFSAYNTTAENVDENPFVAPDNTYKVMVSQSEVTDFGKDGGPDFFSIEYTIEGGPHGGKRANMLFRMTPLTAADGQENWETANARTVSNYKKALLDLGMSEAGMNMFNPRTMGNKLVGIKGTARVFPSKREGYNNISGFQREAIPTVNTDASASPAVSTPAVNTAVTEPNADALANLLNGF